MAADGLICLGSIARPHGIRGECVADLLLEDSDILHKTSGIYLLVPGLCQPGEVCRQTPLPQPKKLAAFREHKGRLLLHFQDVQDRNAAETLRGLLVCIKEQELPLPENDDVFCFQLVGCRVLLPDGQELGSITEVITPTEEQEIWSISTADGREVLFPAHPETVGEIDIQAQQVRIAPPEGLLELYLGASPDEE